MKILRLILTAFCFSLALSGCFLTQDRTTVVYGTITDEKGRPVDSILVVVKGREWWRGTRLAEKISDKDGKYELVIEVSKKFDGIDVAIPFGNAVNPRFQRLYKDYQVFINGRETKNCCNASIGEKTRYDFKLISK